MHITTIILLIFLLISIGNVLYYSNALQWNIESLIATLFLIITIYSTISIYDQECIIMGKCKTWGWIRFWLIVIFIIIPILSIRFFGKNYIEKVKKKYSINI